MVVAHYGERLIREQTLGDYIPQWGDAALKDSGLWDDAVATSDLEAGPLDDENVDYLFTIKVQVMRTPELGQYKGLEVPRRKVEISDEQVDENLAMLQERLATLQPVEDRPVQLGDFVLMDLESTHEGELIEGAQGTDQMFEVGQAQLIPGFEEQLIGVQRGEEKTFQLVFPDDYQAEELAGKEATFTIAVKEIKTKVVPELDDAFAADVSEFETLDGLRADVRERLLAAAEDAANREYRAAAVDKVVENSSVSVPKAMIEREAHRLFHELERDIEQRGVSMDAYLGVLEKSREEAEEGMQPQAENLLKRHLVLQAIAEAEEIAVSDDDITEVVKRDAEALGRDYLEILAELRKSRRQERLRDELLLVKTVDFIAEHAVPVEMDESAEEAVEEGADADAASVS
jgi:trigger factor